MGLLTRAFWPSGPTLGMPLFLSAESKRRGTHGIHPRQQPPSAWQASLDHINQIFLLQRSCRVLHPTWNNLLSVVWLWSSAKMSLTESHQVFFSEKCR
jgi:hypothetical protein